MRFIAMLFVMPIICLLGGLAQAQVAKLKAPSTAKTSSIVTVDLSGTEGDEVDLAIIPPIEQMVEDTGGKLIYVVPSKPGRYTIVLTAYKGAIWDQESITLVVLGKSADEPVDPLEPPADDVSEFEKVSRANIPDTDQDDIDKQAKWFNDLADSIIDDELTLAEVFVKIQKASKGSKEVKGWDNIWKNHFNALSDTFAKANLVLPKQLAAAFHDIAKGLQ